MLRCSTNDGGSDARCLPHFLGHAHILHESYKAHLHGLSASLPASLGSFTSRSGAHSTNRSSASGHRAGVVRCASAMEGNRNGRLSAFELRNNSK